ncbi:N-acetylneuraminate synthase [Zhenpiania hominis]|uniref:N-acetylneuraminate synthase n=1 Tax=Zhenpiania hominis TaxID=2763644 RepID=A0A923NM59_9FIRM|nr:N-acetylneuraminate synthase [Zhenpiania hominis]MBC6681084.1 N-acetylneuraminate synthase [Zhenpiania hominis]
MRHVCIIAEAGVNHNGSFELAQKMVDVAKDAGADYVKFQTFKPKELVSKFAEKAEYQKKTTDAEESQLEMLRKLTLTNDNFIALKEYCSKVGIGFLSTPFDLDSISFLETFNMDFWKVPSGEVTNLPYLEAIAKTGRKIVMSTGMCSIQEIKSAVTVLEKFSVPEIILLHCNTQYPTPYEHVNLSAMNTIKEATGKAVGYSDHTQGLEVPVAAVAMGATVIEKHFTLDKSMDGPDHKASINPAELKRLVISIRNIEKAIGTGKKELSPSEIENKVIARKSIVASREIKKGEILTDKNMTTKRPGNGISPMQWHMVLGTSAIRNFSEDELIEI